MGQKEIDILLAPVEQVLREQRKTIDVLTEKNKKLQVEIKQLLSYSRIVDDELRNDCVKYLENRETYSVAIREAGVILEERLRKTIGGPEPKTLNGIDLVNFAFSKNSGRLSISDHPAEQEGLFMLFRGAVQFVRNPPSHKKIQYTEMEAWHSISLIDYLLLLLKQAKSR